MFVYKLYACIMILEDRTFNLMYNLYGYRLIRQAFESELTESLEWVHINIMLMANGRKS